MREAAAPRTRRATRRGDCRRNHHPGEAADRAGEGEDASHIASLLGIEPGRVNVKGKSHERVDAVGESRAVEAHVVALLVSQPDPTT